MRITKQTDYGIVLLTYFARNADRKLSARELADRSRLPQPTVTKILKMLCRGKLLRSQRGVNGGYSLAYDAATITIGQVISVIEGPIALTQCSANAVGCEQEQICPARPNWRRLDEAVRGALESVTLVDMAYPMLPSSRIGASSSHISQESLRSS